MTLTIGMLFFISLSVMAISSLRMMHQGVTIQELEKENELLKEEILLLKNEMYKDKE